MPDSPVRLVLHHAVAGRVRLRARRALDADELRTIGDRIGQTPGIRRVLVRPNTRSLIVECDGRPEPVLEAIATRGIARIVPPDPPPQIGQIARLGLLQADLSLKRRTEDALDFNSAVALLLVLGAAIQAGRGRIASPASTLLLAALSMLDRGDRK